MSRSRGIASVRVGTMARLAMELMLNIAARRHDAHLIGRQHLRTSFDMATEQDQPVHGQGSDHPGSARTTGGLDAMPRSDALTSC